MDACGDALYEYEGIRQGVSRRTVQLDIQTMRSEKLGYSAPIVVTDKKYYSYEEKGYSITNTPLTTQDMGTLNEVLGVLKQFKGFGYFGELQEMVTRLEDKLHRQQNQGASYIDFEKNELLKGLEHIDPLHKAIRSRKTLEITYRSFKATRAQNIVFYPYLLKEYRNRWFLLGASRKSRQVMILALDRIEGFIELHGEKYVDADFSVPEFFSDVVGVSKMPQQRPQLIVYKVITEHAPYMVTKPMHPSQKILKEDVDGTIFSISVIWNFELEREILGYADFIKVLSPKRLAGKIIGRSKRAAAQYMRVEEVVEG